MADKKKEVYDEDLESLVNERDRDETAIYSLTAVDGKLAAFRSSPLPPSPSTGPDGIARTVREWGNRPH